MQNVQYVKRDRTQKTFSLSAKTVIYSPILAHYTFWQFYIHHHIPHKSTMGKSNKKELISEEA